MFLSYIKEILLASLDLLNGTSAWLIASYLLAGLTRDIISPARLQKSLGNTKISSIIKSTLLSMCLPVCSCGSVPLGISMYESGAYVGPTLAFFAGSPILNPASIILSFGLLGKEITLINIGAGLILPIIIGVLGNKLAGDELMDTKIQKEIENIKIEKDERSIFSKMKSGLKWVNSEFAVNSSKYIVFGMLFGGFLLVSFPQAFIQKYLGDPGVMTLWNVALLATLMYVCAVGHIPFIAALIASGASPGAAITFLMAGASTNLPELISIYKAIGKRAAMMYATIVTAAAFIVGYLTNKLLMPGFVPAINFNMAEKSLESVNRISFIAPPWFKYLCSVIVFLFFLKGFIPEKKSKLEKVFN